VDKVGTSKAGGTISQQAAVHPWLAADAHENKQMYLASTVGHIAAKSVQSASKRKHNKKAANQVIGLFVFLCSKRQHSSVGASLVLRLRDLLTFGHTSSGI
jgi:hypothetical protein